MRSNQLWQLIGSAVIVGAVVGCNSNSSGDTAPTTTGATASATTTTTRSATGADSDKPVEVAFITSNASEYWTIAKKGVDKAKSELKNVTVDFEIPAQGTTAEQKQLVQNMIAKGVQGMAMSPVNPTNETQLINDTAKKVLLFTQDSDAPGSDRACYIGSDNAAAGKQAGEEILKALPNGGKIMVFVGDKDAQNAHDRYQGLLDALKGSKVQVLDERTDDKDRQKAISNVSDALVKEPDLAGCVGLWSYNGPAILTAVKNANKIGKVKIVCFDTEEGTVAGLKDGSIFATIVQQPFVFGQKSIETLVAYLRGNKSIIPANKQIIIPTQAIESSGIAKYMADQDALLKK